MALPGISTDPADGELDARLAGLLETAHRVWSSPDERRRMRAFGWRPAVAEGVLKREWHGLRVRVSASELRAARPEGAAVRWCADRGVIVVDGDRGQTPAPEVLEVVRGLLEMIGAYERWVEAREGRKERISRAADATSDRRTVNALSEARRIQRMLQVTGRARTTG